MKRLQLKKRVALPLIAAALFALALYILYAVAPAQSANEGGGSALFELRRRLGQIETWRLLLWGGMFLSLALVLVRALGEFTFFVFHKRKGYEAPRLMRDLFSLVAYIILIAFILNSVFSLSLSALLPTSALLGVILGLALQDTLGNMFAGISLHADKPFQVGDVITVGKFIGVVESITWRAVKIKTFSNHFVLISNTQIAKESIEVCPRENPNARIVFFSALYTDSPIRVIQVVREALRDCDNVLRYMTPVVRIRDLGQDGVDYEVKYWLKDYTRHNDTDALVRQRIWYAFQRARFTFPFPTRTVHVQQTAAQDGDGKDTASLATRLSAVDIFSPLTADERQALAESSAGHIFAPGEIIIRAGDHGASMFVIHRGSVDVRVETNGHSRTLNTLREGDFFGEMALFTGEPRTASVIAAEETEVLEIGHAAMKNLFETNPDLVESLSHTINERRAGLAAQSATPMSEEDTPAGILNKIRRFFRLD
ncbi:MAG: mechanosensitive ion channel family protein [Acidobacteria bacterium]|nr:mechanosensitive ion channel family protein [Acidobacteriota bacterium]